MIKEKQLGRPKKNTEKKISTTCSILPSVLKKIEKRHKTLTKFIAHCHLSNII